MELNVENEREQKHKTKLKLLKWLIQICNINYLHIVVRRNKKIRRFWSVNINVGNTNPDLIMTKANFNESKKTKKNF